MEKGKIWLNGVFVDWDNANIHILTHALHYATAAFEGIRCYKTEKGPAIFRLHDHIERLINSASLFAEKIQYSKEEISNACKETVKINDLENCYIRPIIFLGEKKGLNPLGCDANIAIAAYPWESGYGAEKRKSGVKLMTSSFKRPTADSNLYTKKVVGNYLKYALAKKEAIEEGFDEALLFDEKNQVTECTGQNIFIVKGNSVITPPPETSLAGITKDTIMKLAKDAGLNVKEEHFQKETLLSADEIFLTGTGSEIVAVSKYDTQTFNVPGKTTLNLQESYEITVHGNNPKHTEWIEFI